LVLAYFDPTFNPNAHPLHTKAKERMRRVGRLALAASLIGRFERGEPPFDGQCPVTVNDCWCAAQLDHVPARDLTIQAITKVLREAPIYARPLARVRVGARGKPAERKVRGGHPQQLLLTRRDDPARWRSCDGDALRDARAVAVSLDGGGPRGGDDWDES
jgi:hypothetical protein